MSNRRERAESIVERSAAYSFACGLVPLPFADMAALTLVHVEMLERLAELYDLPFSRVRAKTYVTALIGGFTATQLGLVHLRAGLALLPVVGPVLSAFSLSATATAVTYMIGRLFIRQFESGGTFMDFETARAVEADRRATASSTKQAIAPPSGEGDDLERVRGIGPKIAALLVANGVPNLAVLAEAKVASLQAILDNAGVSFAYHDPSSWPEQAKRMLAS